MASEIPIQRKQFWDSRGNIKFKEWVKAVERLNLPLTSPTKGSSHHAIRKPGTDLDGPLGLDSFIVNIYEGMSKQVNGDVIRCILAETTITEDEIWRALGKLK